MPYFAVVSLRLKLDCNIHQRVAILPIICSLDIDGRKQWPLRRDPEHEVTKQLRSIGSASLAMPNEMSYFYYRETISGYAAR